MVTAVGVVGVGETARSTRNKALDLTLALDQVAEAHNTVDEPRAIKTLLRAKLGEATVTIRIATRTACHRNRTGRGVPR